MIPARFTTPTSWLPDTAVGSQTASPATFPAALYLVLSAGDLVFSLAAFSYGIAEGNPVLAYLLRLGLFIPAKIGLSLGVAGLMVYLGKVAARWMPVIWAGTILMVLVNIFHVICLLRLAAG